MRYLLAVISLLFAANTTNAADINITYNGSIHITLGCTITGVTLDGTVLPATINMAEIPAINSGMKVGTLGYTSDISCSNPPAFSLDQNPNFVLNGNDLTIGPNNLPAGDYAFSGALSSATTAPGGAVQSKITIIPIINLTIKIPNSARKSILRFACAAS